jgi:aminoglycoside 3-N-acetyltransferase
MSSDVASIREIEAQLLTLGVRRGGVLLVHTSFSSVAPVEGGPKGLIDALCTVLGPTGTVVMPSSTSDDDHPFDPQSTPCRHLGVVADTFWRLPGVLRSDSPHAFAARGPRAQAILAPHPPDVPHPLDSPVGRVHELDGQVLLLGVGHDSDTTVHLAENLAGVRYRRPKHVTVVRDGIPIRVEYGEVDHCCERFVLLDAWLDREQRQAHGRIGRAAARLARSRDIVDVALRHLRADEVVFLHPPGVDAQCDEARASIPTSPS